MAGWVTAAVVGTGLYAANQSKSAANKAASASLSASQTQADAQREQLDYLKQVNALPLQARDAALPKLSQYFGGIELPKSQQEVIDQAKSSPLYAALMSQKQDALDALTANASASGGLRSGNYQDAFARLGLQIDRDALLKSYDAQIAERDKALSGLGGLSGLDIGQNNIASTIGNIGATTAAGQVAAAQAQQQGTQNSINNLMGIAGLGLQGYQAFRTPTIANPGTVTTSDIRLKDNIEFIEMRKGLPWYRWTWNQLAKDVMGLEGLEEGLMAHQIYDVMPEAVAIKDGYLAVNYEMLGV